MKPPQQSKPLLQRLREESSITLRGLVYALAALLLTTQTVQAAETVTYYHYDALGSPVAATDASGNLVWREDYKPYGERIRHEGDATNTLWYTGKPEEAALGLQYFGARWYDPQLGRFTGIDPKGFAEGNVQSFNRYAYANNNPYLFIDPDGRDGVDPTWNLIYDANQNNAAQFKFEQEVKHFVLDPIPACQKYNCVGGVAPAPGIRGGVAGSTKFYRYVGEGEAKIITKTGKIPNVDKEGNLKDVYFTNRLYKTAGKAKTYNQLPSKPVYRVEIEPANAPNRTPFTRVNPDDNPLQGVGGGVEATTRDAIPVDPSRMVRLKGAE